MWCNFFYRKLTITIIIIAADYRMETEDWCYTCYIKSSVHEKCSGGNLELPMTD